MASDDRAPNGAVFRCGEANVSDAHRAALGNAKDTRTLVTEVGSGRPARVISDRLVEELESSGADPLPFPAQWSLTLPLEANDDPDVLGLLAGQSAAMTREMSTTDLMETLIAETSQCFERFSQ